MERRHGKDEPSGDRTQLAGHRKSFVGILIKEMVFVGKNIFCHSKYCFISIFLDEFNRHCVECWAYRDE